jgi:hypothetical protein
MRIDCQHADRHSAKVLVQSKNLFRLVLHSQDALSTLLLLDTQRRSYTIRVWSYETFIVFETVIGMYLAVET